MAELAVVALAVGSAAAYAVSANLKHTSARRESDSSMGERRSLGRFLVATAADPLWWAALVADAAGVALHVLALDRGALAVVQPLLVTGLVVALVLRAVVGRRVRWAEVVWGAVLTAALVGFLAVAGTSEVSGPANTGPAIVVACVGAGFAVGCLLVSRGLRGRVGSAALLGVVVGLVDSSTAALLKSLTRTWQAGLGAVVGSWQLYVVAALAVVALAVNQVAFRSGPLSASLPAIATVDPIASVVLGVVVFNETVRHGAAALVILVVLAGFVVAAVTALVRLETDLVPAGKGADPAWTGSR